MLERDELMKQTKEAFWKTYLRIKRIEAALVHTPGCITRKGLKKQYTYWQVRQNGRQRQDYVTPDKLEEILQKIERMKEQQKRLQELKRFLKELKGMLRAVRLRWQDVLAEYEEQQTRRESEEVGRRAAKEVAARKKYAENYKHGTDRGDQVASKSEVLIANTLYAYEVRYEYERPLMAGGVELKPDFTVWRRDGSMVLWEHAGLLDQPEYERNFEWKLQKYRAAGFTTMKNLIVTYDENGAFSAATARRMLEAYNLM